MNEPLSAPVNEPLAKKSRARRVLTSPLFWFLVLNGVFLTWLIGGVNAASNAEDCDGLTGDSLQLCQGANDVGTTIGAGLVFALWIGAVVIYGFAYLIYRLARRPR